MTETPFHIQVERNIKGLIAEKQFKKAYSLCKELLEKYPEDDFFINLTEEVKNAVRKENQLVIERNLEEAQKFKKEKQFDQVIKLGKNILAIDPENKKAKELIKEAQNKYKEQIEKQAEEFTKKQKESLEKLLHESPKIFLEKVFNIERANPSEKKILAITQELKEKYIEKEISKNEKLLYSEKYDLIDRFISDLKKIKENSPAIQELEKKLKFQQHSNQIGQKKEFIYQAEKQLDTLIKLKKYDKAIILAKEALEVEPSNQVIKKLLEKAQTKFYTSNKEKVIQDIVDKKSEITEDYDKNRDNYIKL